MKIARFILAVVALCLLLLPSLAQDSQTLTVFAAASLTDAFEELAVNFETANPGVDVVFNFGGSSQLATQLSEGAPADVFASANARQMTVAQDAQRIGAKPVTFVKNRLVVAVPADNPAGIQSLADLGNEGVKLVIAAPDVPVRDYTNTMVERLSSDAVYGAAFAEAFTANVVSEEPNVRQVVAKVALGEADAGIVYISDITPDVAEQVSAIAIPDAYNTLATYPIAITDNAANPELAQAFVDYVRSDEAQDILVSWNFISARIPALPDTITVTEGATTLDGQVLNPLTLTAEYLEANFPAVTLDVTYKSGEDTVTTQFTGALLWDVIGAAQPNFNADVRNDKLSTFIVVTASDNYQAVIALGEIDPEFGNQPILVAYAEAGEPIADPQGALRLVVPGDARGGRYVSGIVNISLRDAPHVGK